MARYMNTRSMSKGSTRGDTGSGGTTAGPKTTAPKGGGSGGDDRSFMRPTEALKGTVIDAACCHDALAGSMLRPSKAASKGRMTGYGDTDDGGPPDD